MPSIASSLHSLNQMIITNCIMIFIIINHSTEVIKSITGFKLYIPNCTRGENYICLLYKFSHMYFYTDIGYILWTKRNFKMKWVLVRELVCIDWHHLNTYMYTWIIIMFLSSILSLLIFSITIILMIATMLLELVLIHIFYIYIV